VTTNIIKRRETRTIGRRRKERGRIRIPFDGLVDFTAGRNTFLQKGRENRAQCGARRRGHLDISHGLEGMLHEELVFWRSCF
jgi:hypothetical protein